jgi:hypothetical protein
MKRSVPLMTDSREGSERGPGAAQATAPAAPSTARPWRELPIPRTTDDFRCEQAAIERGWPYLRLRTPSGFTCVPLDASRGSLDVGRNAGNGLCLEFDRSVSGRHARLIHGAGVWSVADIGSTNGTLLNGKPLVGERRLRQGAEVVVGETVITFHDPREAMDVTAPRSATARRLFPNRTQQKVLIELARPWFEGDARRPTPPTNTEIATRLAYQVSTVRDAISDLYKMAGLARGATSQREALVEIALDERVATSLDYAGS